MRQTYRQKRITWWQNTYWYDQAWTIIEDMRCADIGTCMSPPPCLDERRGSRCWWVCRASYKTSSLSECYATRAAYLWSYDPKAHGPNTSPSYKLWCILCVIIWVSCNLALSVGTSSVYILTIHRYLYPTESGSFTFCYITWSLYMKIL